MSICRMSSDNWKCDLYCYYAVSSGIKIHVRAKRYKGNIPKLPDISEVTPEEYVKADKKQMDFINNAKKEPIGLPEDGNTFVAGSIKEFREQLTYLRNLGYNFPDYLFEVDEEP